ncbi:MAG TPA: tRNA glutamyl-Q(34) synthetase GluQRS [Gammaproteobacteria bacterium]|nr:tRNA glutamyl-Q(34) synthetase GluQRS [Gammaproteobacteria bacterium]
MVSIDRSSSRYVGRFAPSPTGPLHFGSVVAAVASYLQARSRGGRWIVRIEDIDPPREEPGATSAILKTLDELGLEWDGAVRYQSHMSASYEYALERLQSSHMTFACTCSRKKLVRGRYPGTCRDAITKDLTGKSIRVKVDGSEIAFNDLLQGHYSQNIEEIIGDYIVKRADGFYAYHLAVVVDDAADGVSEIVRGLDLLSSTPRQIHLQNLLGLTTPSYAHIPLVLSQSGTKLSKQTAAPAIDLASSCAVLIRALEFLQQAPPPSLYQQTRNEIIQWAISNWNIAAVNGISRAYPN